MQIAFSQLQSFFNSLSVGKRISLTVLVAGTLAAFAMLIAWSGRPEYQLLYNGLAAEDAGLVIAKLKEQKTPYKLADNGSSILIPKKRIQEVRMDLASQGMPKSKGVGFEIFDNTRIGMTEFSQNINYQRALQGELARTIDRFEEIESTRVHIVMAARSLFIDKEEPASASVVLNLKPGRYLNKVQIRGIVHLISSSVSGLEPENVTVVDNFGSLLTGPDQSAEGDGINASQLEYQHSVERDLEKRIQNMLETALGQGKATIKLSCDMNFSRHEQTEERFIQDNQVVRSEQLFNETATRLEPVAIGIPGTPTDANALKEVESGGSKGQEMQKQDRSVNYEIGKVTRHVVEPYGQIKRISAAVMVDGTYKQVELQEGQRQWQYQPRSDEEMRKLEDIVKGAINFDQNRGDVVQVVNMPFEKEKPGQDADVEPPVDHLAKVKKYLPLVKPAIPVLFLVLTFFFVVRPLVRWLTAMSEVGQQLIPSLPKTVGEVENEMAVDVKGLPYIDQASHLLTNNQQAVVELMREWMKQE